MTPSEAGGFETAGVKALALRGLQSPSTQIATAGLAVDLLKVSASHLVTAVSPDVSQWFVRGLGLDGRLSSDALAVATRGLAPPPPCCAECSTSGKTCEEEVAAVPGCGCGGSDAILSGNAVAPSDPFAFARVGLDDVTAPIVAQAARAPAAAVRNVVPTALQVPSTVTLPQPRAQSVDSANLQALSKLTPDQQKQLVDYANLQALAKLTPQQQKQPVDYANLQALAKLTPQQQKQLVNYTNEQALSKLTPDQQQQLVNYANAGAEGAPIFALDLLPQPRKFRADQTSNSAVKLVAPRLNGPVLIDGHTGPNVATLTLVPRLATRPEDALIDRTLLELLVDAAVAYPNATVDEVWYVAMAARHEKAGLPWPPIPLPDMVLVALIVVEARRLAPSSNPYDLPSDAVNAALEQLQTDSQLSDDETATISINTSNVDPGFGHLALPGVPSLQPPEPCQTEELIGSHIVSLPDITIPSWLLPGGITVTSNNCVKLVTWIEQAGIKAVASQLPYVGTLLEGIIEIGIEEIIDNFLDNEGAATDFYFEKETYRCNDGTIIEKTVPRAGCPFVCVKDGGTCFIALQETNSEGFVVRSECCGGECYAMDSGLGPRQTGICGTRTSCAKVGEPCREPGDCCGSIPCADFDPVRETAICGSPPKAPTTCVAAGDPCSESTALCCAGSCFEGRCPGTPVPIYPISPASSE